jgi:hypothetical protein
VTNNAQSASFVIMPDAIVNPGTPSRSVGTTAASTAGAKRRSDRHTSPIVASQATADTDRRITWTGTSAGSHDHSTAPSA